MLADDGLLLDEEDDGLAEEPLLGVSEDEELELGELELGVELELELLLGGVELGLELMDPEPDIEPLGLLLGLVDEPELLELPDGDDAPRLASGPLLQPYKLVTATAIGRMTTAVFLRILICGAPLLMEGV